MLHLTRILVSSYAAYIIFLPYDVIYALSYIHICILSNFFSNVFFFPAGVPLNFLGLGAGGGCGIGLGLGWGFGTAFGSQYRSSRVTFQGLEFGRENQQQNKSEFKDTPKTKGTKEIHGSR
ncbi:hypothetical protein SLEP1_g16647 [Rubroshorea leprosula]|uniref:Uncharacterized protein n=1 Tax=Rubroshorea leprosula TaxID=152421 RepID=A0AAV5J361_9ROSI|nr:hypothetical protein SLEP1_g16647 [Rubroshorea leprosula]